MSNFEEWDAAYAKHGRGHKNKYPSDRVVGWVFRNFPNRGSCLDIGCGWGNNLRFLLAEGYDAVGIYFSHLAIESIRNEFGSRVRCESIVSTSWPDNHFDFVIDRCSVQHNSVMELPKIFGEINRVLRPGGRFYSELRYRGDDGFSYAGPNIDELRLALQSFKSVDIDFLAISTENQTRVFESWLIDATK
jgi:SAM-dependent methyltransferase